MKSISWGERFALILEHSPSDEQILKTFHVDEAELRFARDCLHDGVFRIRQTERVKNLGNVFTNNSVEFANVPRFASKPKPVAKKRGRKGDNIETAFAAVPNKPTCVVEFCKTYKVSLPVLRQGKSLDKTGLPGSVRVKKLKINDEKQLMVWRELTN